MSNRSKRDLEVEVARLKTRNQELRRYGFLGNFTKICGELIRAVRVTAPWVFIWLSVRDLAGKQTSAAAKFQVESKSLSDVLEELVTQVFSLYTLLALLLIAAVAGIIYGKRQASLRSDDVERLGEYKKKFEELVDPRRSSSTITRRGETRPEDE